MIAISVQSAHRTARTSTTHAQHSATRTVAHTARELFYEVLRLSACAQLYHVISFCARFFECNSFFVLSYDMLYLVHIVSISCRCDINITSMSSMSYRHNYHIDVISISHECYQCHIAITLDAPHATPHSVTTQLKLKTPLITYNCTRVFTSFVI